jgi:ATP-dependent DNA helicase PIF1
MPVQVLNQVRLGRCDNQATALLRATSRNQLDADGILATKLYTRNSEVDAINERCLRQLSKQSIYYPATDTGQQPFLDQLAKNCLAPAKLELKEGAQVMLLKNLDQENGLVNGTRGVVFKFEDNQNADTGPLGHWPWVRFVGFKGQVDRLITPDKFSVESQGQTLASREQVPLRLAYAITIHKCQGMTLTHAELNLGSAFEFGQAYVALSRVQSLEGLRLVDFDPCAVKAHPRVLDFYQTMKRKNLETDRMNGSRKNPLFVDD